MAARPSWKAFLRLSLVTIPVKGYTAHATTSDLPLHQIHAKCHRRIQYRKVCPVHGEATKDEIVSGYEIAKGKYVEIDPDELDKMRSPSDKAINIDTFVEPDAVDPAYYNGQTYYLLPDGAAGEKPYVLLRDGMASRGKHAVAQTVLSNKERVVLLRPLGKLIAMELLHYENEVKAADKFEKEVPAKEPAKQEEELVHMLIKSSTAKRFDLGKYKDRYKEKLKELIEAKAEGKEIAAPEDHEPHVINLMDALKKSLEEQGGEGHAKPPKKRAGSIGKRAARKRKSA
jgi:DNA end-binding protein Ku